MIVELIDYHKPLLESKKFGSISNKLVSGRYFAATDNKNYQVLIDAYTVVGYCHYAVHEGLIDADDFKDHRCLQKNCTHFEPYVNYPYLKNHPEILMQLFPDDDAIVARVKKKQKQIEVRRKWENRGKKSTALCETSKKQKEQRQERLLGNIKMLTEQLFAETDSYFMHVVRVKRISPNKYKIYLVSDEDRRYNLEFIQYVQNCLKKMYPGKYIFHRIPSLYGTYATKYDLDHRNKCQMVV